MFSCCALEKQEQASQRGLAGVRILLLSSEAAVRKRSNKAGRGTLERNVRVRVVYWNRDGAAATAAGTQRGARASTLCWSSLSASLKRNRRHLERSQVDLVLFCKFLRFFYQDRRWRKEHSAH